MLTKSKNAKNALTILEVFENIGLIIISLATIFALYQEILFMISNKAVTLADLLLLFLYLEVLAMVSLYYSSGKLPIRFPLYISIVALARYIIIDMKSLEKDELIYIAIAILLISFATLVIRYGHIKFPYPEHVRKDSGDDK